MEAYNQVSYVRNISTRVTMVIFCSSGRHFLRILLAALRLNNKVIYYEAVGIEVLSNVRVVCILFKT